MEQGSQLEAGENTFAEAEVFFVAPAIIPFVCSVATEKEAGQVVHDEAIEGEGHTSG